MSDVVGAATFPREFVQSFRVFSEEHFSSTRPRTSGPFFQKEGEAGMGGDSCLSLLLKKPSRPDIGELLATPDRAGALARGGDGGGGENMEGGGLNDDHRAARSDESLSRAIRRSSEMVSFSEGDNARGSFRHIDASSSSLSMLGEEPRWSRVEARSRSVEPRQRNRAQEVQELAARLGAEGDSNGIHNISVSSISIAENAREAMSQQAARMRETKERAEYKIRLLEDPHASQEDAFDTTTTWHSPGEGRHVMSGGGGRYLGDSPAEFQGARRSSTPRRWATGGTGSGLASVRSNSSRSSSMLSESSVSSWRQHAQEGHRKMENSMSSMSNTMILSESEKTTCLEQKRESSLLFGHMSCGGYVPAESIHAMHDTWRPVISEAEQVNRFPLQAT
jgi:hypothetical protein